MLEQACWEGKENSKKCRCSNKQLQAYSKGIKKTKLQRSIFSAMKRMCNLFYHINLSVLLLRKSTF